MGFHLFYFILLLFYFILILIFFFLQLCRGLRSNLKIIDCYSNHFCIRASANSSVIAVCWVLLKKKGKKLTT